MFTMYVANYFVIVFFNVALVGVANSRLMGGNWTFRDGIELAWARKGTILQWAFVASTVGMILRTIEERMGLIGRLVMRSEEHTSELQSHHDIVCRLLLEKKKELIMSHIVAERQSACLDFAYRDHQ